TRRKSTVWPKTTQPKQFCPPSIRMWLPPPNRSNRLALTQSAALASGADHAAAGPPPLPHRAKRVGSRFVLGALTEGGAFLGRRGLNRPFRDGHHITRSHHPAYHPRSDGLSYRMLRLRG